MTAQPFVHLHCHSHYSLLDGASPIRALVERARSLGMSGLALTDHGNLYGALEFYQACRDAGLNPIIGYEAYVAPHGRLDKGGTSGKEASFHLTLLAANRGGFENLIKLSSLAFLEGFYHKPRIDRELLEQYHEGIICLSGCVSGELSRALLRGQGSEDAIASARPIAEWFSRLFQERYFIEIQNNGLPIQQEAMRHSVDLANQVGLPLVCTSDAHYVNQEDAEAQDVLLCINTGRFRTDTNRLKMEGDQFFLRSQSEMYAAFPGFEEALARTQQIADSVDIQLDLDKRHFPTFQPPAHKSSADYLRELCQQGLEERYAGESEYWDGEHLGAHVRQRLDRELTVIDRLGFNDYFLIVWDFVRYAMERDIPCTARGSGVGSLVCYALRLSHVCPLKYDLLFERFLDENRREAPDIDIDFCKERRGEVIQYVKDKYGEANVAQIGTFGTLAARAAIRDVGRTMGLPVARVDEVVAMVPDQLGITLDDALAHSDDLQRAYKSDDTIKELIDLARKIEGLARNVGTHAAAVVIAEQPVDRYVPLQRIKGKNEVITQWAMGDVERAGLLKMDFLGLRNLTILAKSIDLIEQSTGQRLDPHRFPLDDGPTFALLARGETKGIFQLESGGIRDLLQRMRPDNFLDIVATNALYRPGPLEGGMVDDYIEVKHGRQQPSYPHPVMEEILTETHGVMVYQEQVMRILNRLGNIELSDAYTCIKAISKKKLPIIAKYREAFIAGAEAQGLARKKADELFGMIEKFAGYGFNKSHSTAYALIAYMTAYLKAHYPVEFMAALLSGDIPGRNFKSKDALVEHLEDCRRMNIEVVPPDINSSDADFIAGEGKIFFGLSAIKGCGSGAAAAIVSARRREGPFRDLFDFCERVDPQLCNKMAMETLVKAGACDSLERPRAQLFAAIERAMQSGAAVMADRRSGQKGLFDDDQGADAAVAELPAVEEWDQKRQLSCEKEVLGFYLRSHPLAEHQDELQTFCSHTTRDVGGLDHKSEVLVGGLVSAIRIAHTKNARAGSSNTKYAMWDLEDGEGTVRCIMWPDAFAQFGHLVEGDAILGMVAKVDRRPGSEDVNLIVGELIPLDQLAHRYTSCVVLRLRESEHGDRLRPLREILQGYPGPTQVKLRLELADGDTVHVDCPRQQVRIVPEMRRRIEELLGSGNFRLVATQTTAAPPVRSGREAVGAYA